MELIPWERACSAMGTLTRRSHSPLTVAKHQIFGAKSRQLIRMTRIWILTCTDA